MFHIAEVEKNSAVLGDLVSELDAFQEALYPAESNHLIDLKSMSDENIRCLVVHDKDDAAAGCGAVLLHGDGSGELKRIYIRPEYRGKKLGEQIVDYLEKIAKDSGCKVLRLETGIHQASAIVLYNRCGYEKCEVFLPYVEDPLSVFMMKHLSPGS